MTVSLTRTLRSAVAVAALTLAPLSAFALYDEENPIVAEEGEFVITMVPEDVVLPIEGETVIDDGAVIDPMPVEGEIVIDDGAVIDPMPADGESICGGCEYTTTSVEDGGPILQPTTETVSRSDNDNRTAVEPLAPTVQRNICYEADLYVGWLCDWQRPFVGHLMP